MSTVIQHVLIALFSSWNLAGTVVKCSCSLLLGKWIHEEGAQLCHCMNEACGPAQHCFSFLADWDMFTSSLASLVAGDSSNDGTVEMVQTEEKLGPAECPICHKVLCNYFIMKRHMVLHDQNRLAYECALCNKAFKWKHGLIRHCRTAHAADVDLCWLSVLDF